VVIRWDRTVEEPFESNGAVDGVVPPPVVSEAEYVWREESKVLLWLDSRARNSDSAGAETDFSIGEYELINWCAPC